MTDAGISTCPLCGVRWVVTPARDCLVPACGCYGHDVSYRNPERPCEPCGLVHATACPKIRAAHPPAARPASPPTPPGGEATPQPRPGEVSGVPYRAGHQPHTGDHQ